MAKMNGQGLEALAVRRTAMADADKVRYRVYRSADDFVAVIAESALMAVKVSGIDQPQRIVRDLPTEGVAIQAERMENGDSGQRVNLSLQKVVKETQFAMPRPEEIQQTGGQFVPMQLRDLDQKARRTMRILSPQDLETIASGPAKPAPAAAEPAAQPEPEPMQEAAAAEPPADNGDLTPEQVAALLKE